MSDIVLFHSVLGLRAGVLEAADRLPYRDKAELDSFEAGVRASGARYEQFDYPGNGHLFTDRTLPDEFDEQSAELLFSRMLAFLDQTGQG